MENLQKVEQSKSLNPELQASLRKKVLEKLNITGPKDGLRNAIPAAPPETQPSLSDTSIGMETGDLKKKRPFEDRSMPDKRLKVDQVDKMEMDNTNSEMVAPCHQCGVMSKYFGYLKKILPEDFQYRICYSVQGRTNPEHFTARFFLNDYLNLKENNPPK